MTSCCHPHQMPWSGATGAIARCKRVSTGCGRKSRSVRVLRWICGVKLKPKAVNKPLHHFIVHGLDKPGSSATVSKMPSFQPLSLNFSQFVEGRRWCPWAREGLEKARVFASDEPCNSEEIHRTSARFDALQTAIN